MSTRIKNLDSSPEVAVVGLAQSGNQSAFAELLRRHQSWVRNLMWRCCGDQSLADDLAQQAFLQAWRKIRSLKEQHKFSAWLRRLAMTTWLQHARKNDMLKGADELEDQSLVPPSNTGLKLDLDRALATLPPMVRTCIVLSYHESLTHMEIAKSTDLALGTVKSHIRRGNERLKQILSAYDKTTNNEASS